MLLKFFPFLFLLACTTTQKTISLTQEVNQMTRLHDIWALEEMDGIGTPSDLQKHPTLEIFVQDKKALGNDGCNSFSGSIKKISETEITFGPMISTKMACENMAFSKTFNTKMIETNFYTLEKNHLVLYNSKHEELMRFKKVD